MRSLCLLVSTEFLKLKRTLALRLAFLIPIALTVFVVGAAYARSSATPTKDSLIGFAQLTLTLWSIVVLPFYIALTAALIAAIEHQSDSWRHLLALPIGRRSLYIAKWVAAGSVLLIASLTLPTAVALAAEGFRFFKPGWSVADTPTTMVFRGALLSYVAAGLVFSIQMWISFRWRSFIPGLAVAVGALVCMFAFIPRGAGLFGKVFPWSLPAMAMAPHNIHRALVVIWGLAGGGVAALLAWVDLSRREF
jgi:lantibiotic transport system permease protein